MSQVIEVSVSAGSDDAEEVQGTGQVFVNSSDLELINDADYVGQQTVGIRFDGLDIPAGATITAAWIEFTVDETQQRRHDLDHQGAGLRRRRRLSPRRTSTSPAGRRLRAPSPGRRPHGRPSGASGSAQQTADLTVLVQEVVSQPGWEEGNAIAFIVGGSGHRTAEAFEFGPRARRRRCTSKYNGRARRRWRRPTRRASDSFSYTIGDGQGGSATATVTVTVTAANDGPVAVNDTATTVEDTAATIAVLPTTPTWTATRWR